MSKAPDYFLEGSEGMGGYPHSGQGMPSGFKPRDLQQMLRAQKLRSSAKNLSPKSRTSDGGSAGNPPDSSGFGTIRRRGV